MLTIDYCSTPEEIKQALDPLIQKWKYLIPAWCRVLEITDEVNPKKGTFATVYVDTEYRIARIAFTILFLSETPEQRERIVIHELLHIGAEPVGRILRDLFSTKLLGEEIKEFVEEQHRRAFEGMVQDLAISILDNSQ